MSAGVQICLIKAHQIISVFTGIVNFKYVCIIVALSRKQLNSVVDTFIKLLNK